MAKKSQQEATTLAVCQVTRSKEELTSLFQKQIQEGEAILAKYPPYVNNGYYAPAFNPNQADQFYAEYTAWVEFCEELYTTSFSIKETKYLDQFNRAGFYAEIDPTPEKVYNEELRDLHHQIDELKSFIKRIPLIYPD